MLSSLAPTARTFSDPLPGGVFLFSGCWLVLKVLTCFGQDTAVGDSKRNDDKIVWVVSATKAGATKAGECTSNRVSPKSERMDAGSTRLLSTFATRCCQDLPPTCKAYCMRTIFRCSKKKRGLYWPSMSRVERSTNAKWCWERNWSPSTLPSCHFCCGGQYRSWSAQENTLIFGGFKNVNVSFLVEIASRLYIVLRRETHDTGLLLVPV